MSEKIALTHIEALDANQAREELNADTVAAYAQHVIEGGDLPPVIVFKDAADGVYYLADGFHRVAAYKQAERVVIPADVRKGSKRDAFKYALGANEEHGLRRTNADRRRAVTLALQDPELGQLGDRALAKLCKVSHPFVGKVRAKLGNADDSGLDDVDLWEGETDPAKQLARFLACSDLPLVEALWGKGATFETGQYSTAHNHRRALRGIAAAKLHADVAGFIEPSRNGQNAAAVARSEALALYDEHSTRGDEIRRLTTPQEWAKALQWRVLPRDARLVGLIAQRVKVSGGYVENERLLQLLPVDAGFRSWVERKRAALAAGRAQDAEASKTPWPWPTQHEGPDALLAWITAASLDELWKVSKWARYQWNGPDWLRKDDAMIAAVWDRFKVLGAKTEACLRWNCAGFVVVREDDAAYCQVCNDNVTYRRENNAEIVAAARGLLRRGLVSLAELVDGVVTLPPGAPIEAAPVVEAAPVEAAPIEAAPVEAVPIEAAPAYRVGWGDDAEPAKRLCGKLLNIARSPDPHLTIFGDQQGFVFPYLQELRESYEVWNKKRVVPSPLVRWVPVFDVAGNFVNGPGWLDELIAAVNAVAPHMGGAAAPVTPPAVSDTDPPPPIAFADQDLWASAPLARAVIKSLTAYQGGCGKEDESLLKRALVQAAHWQNEKEPIPEGMPEEVLIVLQLAATEPASSQRVVDALASACFAGPVALRWINNAEEDEPVKTTSPTGRAMQAIKDAELGAAAK